MMAEYKTEYENEDPGLDSLSEHSGSATPESHKVSSASTQDDGQDDELKTQTPEPEAKQEPGHPVTTPEASIKSLLNHQLVIDRKLDGDRSAAFVNAVNSGKIKPPLI